MTACFRCHGLEKGAGSAGRVRRVPHARVQPEAAIHSEAGFYPKGHAEMAMEAKAEVDKAKAEAAEGEGARRRGAERESERREAERGRCCPGEVR